MNRYLLVSLLFVLATKCTFSQHTLVVMVSDSLTKKPLEYVSLSYAKKATLTNEFGEAILNQVGLQDTFYLSYIGYHSKRIVITTFSESIVVLLSKKDIYLKEAQVRGYTDSDLAKLLLSAYKKRRKLNSSFAAEIKTYSIKNGHDPVEYINGLYNVNHAGGKLNAIELKYGSVVFPKENFSKNFLSIGITKVYALTNPFGVGDPYFKNPFKLSASTLIDEYKLAYTYIDAKNLMVNYHSKSGNCNGYVIINLERLIILEFHANWIFINNYPLVAINENGMITDTMLISSNTYYDHHLNNQILNFKFSYNKETIVTNSMLSYADSTLYAIPINGIKFNNDYLDILARPKLDTGIMNVVLSNKVKGKLNVLFEEGVSEEILVNGFDLDKTFIEELTNLGFYDKEWNLNWSKLPIGKVNQQFDTKIRTFIFSDFFLTKDSVVYLTEPIFDYAGSTFNYERTAEMAMYISNYMYLTKIEANNLLKSLKAAFPKKIEPSQFKELCKIHETTLQKRLFRYRLETNGGNNSQAMLKWNELILDELDK